MRLTIVDPPAGWRYGFPHPYDPKPGQTFKEWLLEKGYPEKDLDLAVKYSRWWETEVEEKECPTCSGR